MEEMWRDHSSQDIEGCIEKAAEAWIANPRLAAWRETSIRSIQEIAHAMAANKQFHASTANDARLYKIIPAKKP